MTETGRPLQYQTRGNGYPLFLVHTLSVDCRVWDYQMDDFAERFHVVRYDLRGHGKSPPSKGPFDAQLDLLELLDTFDAEMPYLIGLGVGGSIVLDFALQYPNRIGALVLAGSGIGADPSQLLRLLSPTELSTEFGPMTPDLLTAIRRGDPGPLIEGLVRSPAGPKHEAARELLRQMLRDNAHTLMQIPRVEPKIIQPPAIGRLDEIAVPVLIMVGRRDLAHIQRIADILHQSIAGAKKVIATAAGSYPNLDDPEFFNSTVMEFFSGLRSGQGYHG